MNHRHSKAYLPLKRAKTMSRPFRFALDLVIGRLEGQLNWRRGVASALGARSPASAAYHLRPFTNPSERSERSGNGAMTYRLLPTPRATPLRPGHTSIVNCARVGTLAGESTGLTPHPAETTLAEETATASTQGRRLIVSPPAARLRGFLLCSQPSPIRQARFPWNHERRWR